MQAITMNRSARVPSWEDDPPLARQVVLPGPMVTLVAVMNLILGGLQILYGLNTLCSISLGSNLPYWNELKADVRQTIAEVNYWNWIIGSTALGLGGLTTLTGWGMWSRKRWSLPTGLVLTLLAVAFCFTALWFGEWTSALINGIYSALSLRILLEVRYRREFTYPILLQKAALPRNWPALVTR